MNDVAAAAEICRNETGETNPQDVGTVDGTEDDFGDLISAAFDAMVGVELDTSPAHTKAWDRVQEAAASTTATTMEEFCRVVYCAWYNHHQANLDG